jgi:cytochrome P450
MTATSGTHRIDVDVIADPLPGPALHRMLAEAREAPGLTVVQMMGEPAYLITRFDDLRTFFVSDDQFPGETTYQFTIMQQVGDTFISMENPRHDHYRQLATPAFRSRAVTRFVDDALVPLAHEVVDRFADKGQADLAAELARVLPFWAISRKLGLPQGDEERMRQLAYAMFGANFAEMEPAEAVAEITSLIQPVLDERRAAPGDDVLSQLIQAERSAPSPELPEQLTDTEIINHVRLLFAVGATTTSDSMSSLLWALLTQPGVLETARDDPSTRPAIVHELLRMEPAVPILPRIAAKGGELAGTEIPEGARVLAGIAGANRDPGRFPDPDRFDPRRPATEILSFGFGTKFCPGSHLARQQLEVALDVVLDRLPGLRLVETAEPTGAVLRSTPSVLAAWETA